MKYEHLYVVVEHEEGKPVPVSLEMLGEARRLMDGYNKRYSADEKVVAVVLGHGVRGICEEMIHYGADAVVYADSPELKHPRNLVDTKVIAQIALDKAVASRFSKSADFQRPRYMFFAADSPGRQLSSTVMAQLDSGLASDINKLVIEDLEIKHEHKTKGQPVVYERTLEMYRPDFSGFLWTTILCLDNRNPLNLRDYHPQACSIIPGVFAPMERDASRKGVIVDYAPTFDPQDLKVRVLSRKAVKSAVDYDSKKAVVSFGRGIKDAPEQNIRLAAELAREIDAEVGVSLPISKKPYPVSESVSSAYMVPDRVIGTSGRKVMPLLYMAAGISGAMQHIAGMKESGFVIAINPDEDSPMKDECDLFIKGRMEDVIPALIEELRALRPTLEARK
ncbi:electron transfer flavoprotein subunit alpha/FixB family protein [Candidatus Nitrososphaera sp. FF02]|uniref:electron transfer flavoprotein subunit alpha/FixB family protein n=1 Tax=Candidatus Nitrososphaera sp. FF02 TaxID=3398226 RepID=UPI0039E8324E